ncbi:phosphatidylserine/phosphatidylglycerophosphate/cardiolipin synthase family protein [Saccharopolyspora sp. NPDC000359]|uniref:phospholipase D-like domain-containing protein n=1 Tax=Saccharopolyspora sp. NPDC000359 TaxID=3154251 RepID=UPI003326492E
MRIKMLCLSTGLAVAAASGGLASATPATTVDDPLKACSNAAEAPVQTRAVFNEPVGGDPAAIMGQLCSLIKQAPAGSQIRIAHFVVSGDAGADFAEVLTEAHRRGVAVQVVLDGWQDDTPAAQAIRDELGTDEAQPSWLHVCSNTSPEGNTSSCLGTKGNHNKIALFSETAGQHDVVMQSSANLTDVNSRTYWNNAVVLLDNPELHAVYDRYFSELAAEERTSATEGIFHTDMPGGPVEVYFSPVPEGDPVVDQLAEVRCTPTTRVEVGMSEIDDTRLAVLEQLVRLSDDGCAVRVVHGSIEPEGQELIESTPAIQARTLENAELPGTVHSKFALVDHGTGGWVTTGSQNWNNTSLRRNDEATLTLHQPAVVEAYSAAFDRMFTAAG